jgi:nucleotide-binding universal stress UspA family protein
MKSTTDSKASAGASICFRHLLVPTDLTDRSEKALQLARKLALPHTSRVTLLHVIATVEGVESDELKAFYEQLERIARTTMTKLVRRGSRGPVQPDC